MFLSKTRVWVSFFLVFATLICMLSGCDLIGTEPLDLGDFDLFGKREMSSTDLAKYAQERTVTIEAEDAGIGTGFFIDSDGTLVTCFHVIEGASNIAVKTMDGANYQVMSIIDVDPLHDIAILKIDGNAVKYFDFGTKEVVAGESVYAIGSALGHLDGTFSNGVVSAVSRKVGMIECVQTTAAISSGNSGGPLVNAYGEVIGINAFSYVAGENLNLAIKISALDALTKDKNFTMSQYKEWYDKETSRSYMIYNTTAKKLELSTVHTYQYATNSECLASGNSFDFDQLSLGYAKGNLLYVYKYNIEQYDQYTEYLATIGFEYDGQEMLSGSTFSMYSNEFTGVTIGFYYTDDLLCIIVLSE